jgi:hypothetical protein
MFYATVVPIWARHLRFRFVHFCIKVKDLCPLREDKFSVRRKVPRVQLTTAVDINCIRDISDVVHGYLPVAE